MTKKTYDLATTFMIAEKDGAVGNMIFNNPKSHNAVKLEMWEAIPTILDHFEADPDIKVIVLKGAGDKAFVSGADISEFEQNRSTPEAVKYYEDVADSAMERLAKATKPTICAIRGYCIGGGAGISLGCDMRIATENSKFGVPAAKLGVGYRLAGIRKLVDVVGPSFAKEIFFTARQFTAPEALNMGLINRMTGIDELEDVVAEYCDTIAANAPLTIDSVKRIVAEVIRGDGPADAELCEQLVQDCFASEDYVEGRTAFMEKRKADFKGR